MTESDYKVAMQFLEEYKSTATETLKENIREVFSTWKGKYLAEKAGIDVETLYGYTKNNKNRPSYESYIKIMAIGKNPYYKGKKSKPHRLIVCTHCYEAICSHEGKQIHKECEREDLDESKITEYGYFELYPCEWCNEETILEDLIVIY